MESTKKSEIRRCIIQFTEITGFDQFGDEIEPEEYAEIISDITKMYDDIIGLYEGHVDKHEGKIFMATFGVPISHEEDPERAIRASLLLKNRIEEYNKKNNTPLLIRVGINLGRVYAGSVGSDIKKEYTVMGDAVNIAARIMENAKNSQILVSEEIHRITKHVFKYNKPKQFLPKGTTQEIKVFDVQGQSSKFIRRRGIEGLHSPLVGRTESFNILKNFLRNLIKDKGTTVALIGEAGVGKSRLIEELFTYSLSIGLEQAKVINWCSGNCSPYKETIYLPFIEIIKQICNISSDDTEKQTTEQLIKNISNLVGEQVDDIYPYIANLMNVKMDSRYEDKIKYLEPKVLKLQTHVAIASILRNYASREPCVFIFDDLYLADSSTIEALHFFLETGKEIPMYILLLTRPIKDKPFWKMYENLKDPLNIQQVILQRLNRRETKKISQNLLQKSFLPVTFLNEIIGKADGNPFFLEEIIKLLIAEKILYKENNEWKVAASDIEVSIPYTIESIIRNRFDTLKSDVRSILEEMAVVGRNFSKKILNTFSTHWETLDDLIEQAVNMDFISTENNEDYLFNHALVREVINSGIPQKRKKALHLRVGSTLEQLYKDRLPEFYEILFEHFSETDEYEKAIKYGLKAAENAKKKYANHEAILFYLSVLKELDNVENANQKQMLVCNELGKIHSLIGQTEDALEFFKQAIKYSETNIQQAKIYEAIADTYESMSSFDKAIEIYNNAINNLDDKNIQEKNQIMTGIARCYYEQGNYEECVNILEKALDSIGDSSDIESRKVLAKIYDRLGSACFSLGRRQESFSFYQKALKLYEILDDIHGQGVIYNNLCDYYTGLGDYPKAIENLQKSLEIDLHTGNLLGQAIVHYNIGDTYYQLGDYDKAEGYFNKCLTIHKQVNNDLGTGYATWGIGLIRMEQDEHEKAQEHFNEALAIFNKIGTKMWQIAVMLSIAELYHIQGEFEKAWQLCGNIKQLAFKIKDYDAINDVHIKQAKIRIAQADTNKKLAVTFFQEAQELLEQITDKVEESAGAETKYEIYTLLSQIHYGLGNPKQTMRTVKQAQEIQTQITKHMKEENMKKAFLNRRLYREFEEFRKKIRL